jgi:hypothetical protein
LRATRLRIGLALAGQLAAPTLGAVLALVQSGLCNTVIPL